MKNLGFAAVAVAALAIAGCGGGGTSTPAVTSTTSPTTAPTVAPTPGPSHRGLYDHLRRERLGGERQQYPPFWRRRKRRPSRWPRSNYTGSFAAASSCAQVTVTPATSTTGAFTVTAADAAAAGCTVTFTGNATSTGTLAATVARPSGVALRWYLPNYLTQSPPVPQSAGPINLVGLGSVFATVLAISENNYVGGFPAAKVAISAWAAPGSATLAVANTTTPTGLPTAAPGTSLVYYTVTGAATVLTTGGCTVTATDSYVPLAPGTPNPSVAIGVEITTVTGVFQ